MTTIIGAAAGDIVYNTQDQLIQYGSTAFAYGGRGELVQRVEPTGTTFYDYDAAGGLRVVKLPDGRVIEYVIDGMGRRIGKKVNGLLQKQWVYGRGLGPLAELDAAGTVTMRFVYATKPNVPDFVKVYATSKLYRVFTDQLGTPLLIYDVAAGTNFKTLDFDEFGVPLGAENNPSFEFPFGFAGGFYDRDTKLTRFGARDYDASLGRWLGKDPIFLGGEQTNLYVYAAGDPINLVDSEGTIVFAPILAGFAFGLGADVVLQLIQNGGDFGCVDWGAALLAGGIGAFGGTLGVIGKGARAFEFSHFVPKRSIAKLGLPRALVNSSLNGNYVPASFHAATDAYRYQFVPAALKGTITRFPPGAAQLARTPGWLAGGAVGAAVSD
jgi:RHS repeat-associated protein